MGQGMSLSGVARDAEKKLEDKMRAGAKSIDDAAENTEKMRKDWEKKGKAKVDGVVNDLNKKYQDITGKSSKNSKDMLQQYKVPLMIGGGLLLAFMIFGKKRPPTSGTGMRPPMQKAKESFKPKDTYKSNDSTKPKNTSNK